MNDKQKKTLIGVIIGVVVLVVIIILLITSCSKTNEYTIKFNTDGGSNVSSIKVEEDGLIVNLTTQQKKAMYLKAGIIMASYLILKHQLQKI